MERASHSADEPQILLILIGLPGSGKTTFAEALVRTSDPSDPAASSSSRQWIRASQDDAPSRRRQECEARVRNGLRQGYNVIVDRVGFDAVQRSHFVNIADAHMPRPRVYAMLLDVSVPTLEARLALRTSHPTLADPATAMRVLADMRRQLSPPTPDGGEGFDKIYTLPESAQPVEGDWTSADISRVLDLLEREGQSEVGPRKIIESRPQQRFAPRGGFDQPRGGSYRGRGDYRGRGTYRGSDYRGGRGGYTARPPTFRPYPSGPSAPSYSDQPPSGSSGYRPPTVYATPVRPIQPP